MMRLYFLPPARYGRLCCTLHSTAWFLRWLSDRLQIAEVRCTRLRVRMEMAVGGEGSTSSTARTGSAGEMGWGLRNCLISFWSLTCSCESKSKSTPLKYLLVVCCFLLVVMLMSSSLVLQMPFGSMSSWTHSRGPPKRTLWRKLNPWTEASAIFSIERCQCFRGTPRTLRRDSTWEESIIPRISAINGKTCTTYPWSV